MMMQTMPAPAGTQLTTAGQTNIAPAHGLDLEGIQRWARVFIESGLFKGTTNQQRADLAKAIVKIQYGQELGIPPFAAMNGIDIIDGRPAPGAGLTAALVKRSERYDYRVVRSDMEGCDLAWFENGEQIGASSFTIEEAKAAGLAGKRNWQFYPADMCFSRALTRGARRFCPDLFLGSVYVADELEPSPGPTTPLPEFVVHDVTGEILEGADSPTVQEPPTAASESTPAPAAEPVAHWTPMIEQADGVRTLLALIGRIGAEETNPYHRTGAIRKAAAQLAHIATDSQAIEVADWLTTDPKGRMIPMAPEIAGTLRDAVVIRELSPEPAAAPAEVAG